MCWLLPGVSMLVTGRCKSIDNCQVQVCWLPRGGKKKEKKVTAKHRYIDSCQMQAGLLLSSVSVLVANKFKCVCYCHV